MQRKDRTANQSWFERIAVDGELDAIRRCDVFLCLDHRAGSVAHSGMVLERWAGVRIAPVLFRWQDARRSSRFAENDRSSLLRIRNFSGLSLRHRRCFRGTHRLNLTRSAHLTLGNYCGSSKYAVSPKASGMRRLLLID